MALHDFMLSNACICRKGIWMVQGTTSLQGRRHRYQECGSFLHPQHDKLSFYLTFATSMFLLSLIAASP